MASDNSTSSFTVDAVNEETARIARQAEAAKNAKENAKKLTRAQEAKQSAAIRKGEKDKEEQSKKDELTEEGKLRGKINAYFKSQHLGPFLNGEVERPRPTDKLPALQEKLKEIGNYRNRMTGTKRLAQGLDVLATLGERNWGKFPEPVRFDLTGVAPGGPFNVLVQTQFAPLFEEALIEYPYLSYSPFPARVLETLWGCCALIDQANRNPNFKKANDMAKEGAIPVPPIPQARSISKPGPPAHK